MSVKRVFKVRSPENVNARGKEEYHLGLLQYKAYVQPNRQSSYDNRRNSRICKSRKTEEKGIVSNLRKHAADIVDRRVLASLVVSEIGERCPVGGLVSSHGTGGAVGSGQSIVISNVAETCTTRDLSVYARFEV